MSTSRISGKINKKGSVCIEMMFFVCLKASVLIFNIIEANWRQTEFYLESAGGLQQPQGTDYEVTL